VGRAKEEWMRQQELEPMYEWIEENYGDDVGEEGSETWDEAVQAFEDYCEEQQRLEQDLYWQEEYDYYLTLTLNDADLIFQKDLSELKTMLETSAKDEPNQTFFKMVYAHAVTILEVYLEDIAKALIMTNEAYLANTIRNVHPFCDTKFKLGDISLENDGIKKFVLGKLSDNLFHNIPKVLKMLSGIVEKKLDVPISDICEVTSTRHDIVHRNGKNKNGETIDIALSTTLEALNTLETFANQLRHKLAEI
jgi:hypothetical protein